MLTLRTHSMAHTVTCAPPPQWSLWLHDDRSGEERFVCACVSEAAMTEIIGALTQVYRQRENLWEALGRVEEGRAT